MVSHLMVITVYRKQQKGTFTLGLNTCEEEYGKVLGASCSRDRTSERRRTSS